MFSKYDVYTTVQSMYCYPDSDVLKNKLNIRDKAELKQAEEEFTAVKQLVLLQEPMKGRFTKTHLLRIHRFLFEEAAVRTGFEKADSEPLSCNDGAEHHSPLPRG